MPTPFAHKGETFQVNVPRLKSPAKLKFTSSLLSPLSRLHAHGPAVMQAMATLCPSSLQVPSDPRVLKFKLDSPADAATATCQQTLVMPIYTHRTKPSTQIVLQGHPKRPGCADRPVLTEPSGSDAGLLAKQEGRASFPALKKGLRLLRQGIDNHDPSDVAYLYNGYAPISIRLVRLAAVEKPPCSCRPGWTAHMGPAGLVQYPA